MGQREAEHIASRRDRDMLNSVDRIWPCWPMKPLYDRLQQGEALKRGGYNLESHWCDWPSVETYCSSTGKTSI